MAVSGLHKQRTAHWGIIDSNIGTTIMSVGGVVTDFQISMNVVTQNELNEVGSTISRVQYDERYDSTCTLQVKSSDADNMIKKVVGSSDVTQKITIGGKSNYVQSYDVIESNRNFVKIQFKLFGSRYLGNGSGAQEQNESQSV